MQRLTNGLRTVNSDLNVGWCCHSCCRCNHKCWKL